MKLLVNFLIAILLISCSRSKPGHHYIISNVAIVDVENGSVIRNQFIEISGERISKISGTALNVTDSTVLIDGTGKYIIPGLWDMHTHYYWDFKTNNPLLIANGIIGIREMFGDLQVIKQIRNDVINKSMLAPELISSGPIIDGVPAYWPGSDTISVPQRAADLVKKQVAEGVDFLKVYSGLNRETYFAIAKEAKKNRIPFVGHVPNSVTIWDAIALKQKSIEHLEGVLEGCTKYPGRLIEFRNEKWPDTKRQSFLTETFDQRKLDSLIEVLSKSETWICPTLTVLRALSSLDDPDFKNDWRKEKLPKNVTDYWDTSPASGIEYMQVLKKEFALQKTVVDRMQKGKVKILAGTDFPNPYCFPGFSLHDELALLVQCGLSPLEALRAATINPALFLNKEKMYGSVTVNKFASMVLLNKNPLEDIHNTKEIHAVFLKGRYLNQDELKRLLNLTNP